MRRQSTKGDGGGNTPMDALIKALEMAIAAKNWYGALFIALSVPDICGYLENPHEKSQARYERWFEQYTLPKYRSQGVYAPVHVFLSPADCYALRCALLHEGREEIIEQKAREVLDRFHFTEPHPRHIVHCLKINNVLQLQVNIFCVDIYEGVSQWTKDTAGNPDIQTRLKTVLRIYPSPPPGIISS